MSTPTSFQDDLAASSLNIFKVITYSGLTFLIWEWGLGLSFEAGQIWTKRSSSIVKWQYILSRYLGIAGQIGNTVATAYVNSSHVLPRRFCVGWYIEQMIVAQGLLFSLEVSLIRRLYALFNTSNRLHFTLYTFAIGEHILFIICAALAFRRAEIVEACLFGGPLIELSIIAGTMVMTQCILWGLTLLSGWKKGVPLASLMIRDGSWVFGLVSIAVLGGTANVFAPTHRPVVNPFSIFIAVLASMNCRIIINLETMQLPQRDDTSKIELSTQIDTGGNTFETSHSTL
ncbi:hypothetical protein BDZ94DRAFT_1248663 [Collybia nuda]|uniref:Uncharacterized protein n=1 Tax=Collybia nuda TaxID=64659 RepID=A0A9P5YFE9_9AGAR|nr:hypothetical protein BDZ94DRAFT_1248663 [Collybia nuda]